jgi:hypothetical protein
MKGGWSFAEPVFFIRGYNFTTAGICIWEPDGWNSSAGKVNQSGATSLELQQKTSTSE